MEIPEEDKKNLTYYTEEDQSFGKKHSEVIKRKIDHFRFKNISSAVAIKNLQNEDNGEFYFRPSSRGKDFITLTWKFYNTNIVHIDIKEDRKAPGAHIGEQLQISDEKFDNLNEIVDRYIYPCNRYLREVVTHQKFFKEKSLEALRADVETEKA